MSLRAASRVAVALLALAPAVAAAQTAPAAPPNPAAAPPAPPPVPTTAGKLTFRCSCGQTMMAKNEHAGLKTKCPACEAVVTIPGKSSDTAISNSRGRPTPPALDDEPAPPRRGGRGQRDDFDDPEIDDFDEERPRRGKRKKKKSSALPCAPPAKSLSKWSFPR